MRTANNRSRFAAAVFSIAAALASGGVAHGQAFSEPSTVFYGKVLGTGSARDFLVTEGTLVWTVLRSDGVEVTYSTELFALNDGTLSYRLDVPHAAFALGLDDDHDGIPMPPIPQTHLHSRVTVDGDVAELLGPASSTFTTEQLLRTSTYRLDLAVRRDPLDTDGDGIPDWWEDLYGLNKQDPLDGTLDLTGDGLSVLDAFLRGLDPRLDARGPAILTQELVVYGLGSTAVMLDVVDLDSVATQLTYTVTSLPAAGMLVLRNSVADVDAPDKELAEGDTFTQGDILSSRVVYEREAGSGHAGSFAVDLVDESQGRAPVSATVSLLVFDPDERVAAAMTWRERRRLQNAWYAKRGYVIADASSLSEAAQISTPTTGLGEDDLVVHLASFGSERNHVLVDDSGVHELLGGAGSDVLISGPGSGSVSGGAGDDSFVFDRFATGECLLSGFALSDADIIDLSVLSDGRSGYAQEFVRIVDDAGSARIEIDADGGGDSYTNLSLRVNGLAFADADLYDLVAAGRLLIGDFDLEPRLTVTAVEPQASENGPTPALFTITREGSTEFPVVVNIAMSGSAANGLDYIQIPTSVLLPAGSAEAIVELVPYSDSLTEIGESATLTVTAGEGYNLGAACFATATIEDLLMLVEVEALEPVAVVESGLPGYFMVSRRDVIDRDVLVRLQIGGSASNGSDYERISTFVTMGVNQTFALIEVSPKALAVLDGGMESVTLTVEPNLAYRVVEANSARVSIVDRLDSLEYWRSREFPQSTGELAAFALEVSDGTGINHLERYAFGLGSVMPDTDGLPTVVNVDGTMMLRFRRPVGVTDVDYAIRACTRLGDWDAYSAGVIEMDPPPGTLDEQFVFFRIDTDGDSGYFEVKVEWLP